MALIDEVTIIAQAGNGGNGCISFRREKYVPYGGPNGGNGGRGGSIILEATRDKTSLLDFKYQPKYQGQRGQHGMGSDCDGRGGKDMILKLPLGTLVFDAATGLLLTDLTEHGQQFICAVGGKGGTGNMHFATSTNRAPRVATPGEKGEERELKLELQLIADIGLVGLPNAGKSTFLRSVSAARPKTAAYPFTTLEPHLGVVDHKDQTFVVADLPGLIEGASEGTGLGHQFLRHVTRNRMLLHLVDSSEELEVIEKNIAVIRAELEAYDPELAHRPRLLVFTKIDLLDEDALKARQAELKAAGYEGYFLSAVSHQGLTPLLDALSELTPGWRAETVAETPEEDDDEASPLPPLRLGAVSAPSHGTSHP